MKVWLLTSLILISSTAHGFRVNVEGGVTKAGLSDEASVDPKLGIGGGLLFEFPFGKSAFGVQVGTIYLQRNLHGTTESLRQASLHNPVMVTYKAGPVIKLGLGGYYGHPLDNQSKDFGLEGSIGFSMPATDMFNFLLDARYAWGLSSIQGSESARDIYLFAGFQFGNLKLK